MAKTEVEIYTDGACTVQDRLGGWGTLLRSGRHEKELSGAEKDTTNMRMELRAALEGLAALKTTCPVIIYSDSKYVVNGCNTWVYGWAKNNWKKADGTTILNPDLWQGIHPLLIKYKPTFVWVKGHAGNEFNERVDKLAVAAKESLKKST